MPNRQGRAPQRYFFFFLAAFFFATRSPPFPGTAFAAGMLVTSSRPVKDKIPDTGVAASAGHQI